MPITIKYTEFEDGSIVVNKLDGIKLDKLPQKYLTQKYNVYYFDSYSDKNGFSIDTLLQHTTDSPYDEFILREQWRYPKDDFLKKLRFIRKCGKKLRQINKQIQNENKPKTVKKTITI